MLVEKNLKEALEYYIKGKPVTALWIGEDGGMNAMPLSDILDQPENSNTQRLWLEHWDTTSKIFLWRLD